ncbi:MAG: copper amine oxidase N-terminal domain-containing protein [Defluviitaleaceae bacterium]|nr:copper amine oxidase N-terminal domain-containing protein [Defluviitaleaceae bacterium]
MSKKSTTKRLIALFVAIAMVAALLPATIVSANDAAVYRVESFAGLALTGDSQFVTGYGIQRMAWNNEAFGDFRGTTLEISGDALQVRGGFSAKGFQLGEHERHIQGFQGRTGSTYRIVMDASAAGAAGVINISPDNHPAGVAQTFDLPAARTTFTLEWTQVAHQHNNMQISSDVDFNVYSIVVYDVALIGAAAPEGDDDEYEEDEEDEYEEEYEEYEEEEHEEEYEEAPGQAPGQQEITFVPIMHEGPYTVELDLNGVSAWSNIITEGPAIIALGADADMLSQIFSDAYLVTDSSILRLQLDNTRYLLNGVEGTLAVAPQSIDWRTMVPFRFIGETLGATVSWDGDTETASFTRGGVTESVTIGEAIYYGGEYMGTPVVIGGSTLVPVRYVSNVMGADVVWDAEAEAIYVLFGYETTYSLGWFDQVGGNNWTHYWNTYGRNEGVYDLSIEVLRHASVLVVEFSEMPWYGIDFITMGAGNNWGWTQVNIFEAPEAEETDVPPVGGDDDIIDDIDEPGNGDDQPGDDEDEPAGDEAPPADVGGAASGQVLRHTHGENWGQAVISHPFTNDDYTITMMVFHPAAFTDGLFGVNPNEPGPPHTFVYAAGDADAMESTRAESTPGVWNEITLSFPGAQTTGNIQIGPEHPRAPGSHWYLDNVVITNSAGEVVFSQDFETNASGFSVREWSHDAQTRVTAP